MIANVANEIETEGMQKYINTQRREMYIEMKSKLIDQKLVQ